MRTSTCSCGQKFFYSDRGPVPRGCPVCLPKIKREYLLMYQRTHRKEPDRNRIIPRFSEDEVRRWHKKMDDYCAFQHSHPPNLRLCLSLGINMAAAVELKRRIEES